jgi:ABC-2 type transport system permease protein
LSQFSHPLQTIAAFTPLYGLNQLVHAPLVGGGITWSWVVNVLV